ncbi:response regulator transcription factor [Paractinoplanes pyxinae]|uniref:response regulator transcription factor n=1 Tax=Paractinoplanes pyxinae TaxID=2997416 RepID=UPI003F68D3E6
MSDEKPVSAGAPGAGAPAAAGRTTRVLLVDDDALVRAGLTMMLGAFDDIEVVGAVTDGTEVASAVNTHGPDVVLMDIRMPGLDGLSATESLRRRPDAPQVIVLTTFDTDEHVLRALRAGAGGFLLKHTPPREIADAVRRVAAGEPMMSPEVLRKMIGMVSGADPGRDRARTALARLSPGENDVARLIAEGRTNHEIATELLMSTATVKAYVSRIFTKLSLTNRVQIALLVHDAR